MSEIISIDDARLQRDRRPIEQMAGDINGMIAGRAKERLASLDRDDKERKLNSAHTDLFRIMSKVKNLSSRAALASTIATLLTQMGEE